MRTMATETASSSGFINSPTSARGFRRNPRWAPGSQACAGEHLQTLLTTGFAASTERYWALRSRELRAHSIGQDMRLLPDVAPSDSLR